MQISLGFQFISQHVFKSVQTGIFILCANIVTEIVYNYWNSVSLEISVRILYVPSKLNTAQSLDIDNLPAIMPPPFISVICFREEGMIHFFHRSHAKKPENGLFSDWIGNNSIRQLLLISVCIFACVIISGEYTREFVMKFSANSVFLNSKNV